MRIVLHVPFAAAELDAALRDVGSVEPVGAATKDELRAGLVSADAVVVAASNYDEDIARAVAAARRLRWIHFVTSGVDPLLRYPPPPVPVTSSAAAWAPTVAEHAVALLLALQRRLLSMQAARARRQWAQQPLRQSLISLDAANVTLLGFGEIGRHIARMLKPFGPRLVAVARSDRSHPDVARIVSIDRLDQVLPDTDALVVALPQEPSTRHVVDGRRIAMLPAHAAVVNVGRGSTIDESALAEALRAGRIAGAGLDVFEREPLPPDSPLWDLDNLVISPHVAGMGRSRLFDRLAAACADNARRLLRQQPLVGLVDAASAAPAP